ncbi:ATP-binding cassette domain-containing protein [Pseudoclostridium thermosuccinogenes]|uniref:ATP-binding cassette domain-containing protein n=1 Tax=Clostridium thermosuccinogenes TaxID=84032 RepID=UPI002FD9DB30
MKKCISSLLSIISQEPKRFISLMLIGIVNAVVTIFYTVILQRFVDIILVNVEYQELIYIVSLFLITAILTAISAVLQRTLLEVLCQRILRAKKIKFVHHILNARYSAIRKWNTGQLLDRYNKNDTYANISSDFINDFVVESISFVVIIVYLFRLNTLLAGIVFIGTIITSLAKYFISRKAMGFSNEKSKIEQDIAMKTSDYIESIGQIKNMNINSYVERKIYTLLSKLYEKSKSYTVIVNFLDQASYIIMEVLRAITYIVAGYQVLKSQLTPGVFFAFYAFTGWLDYSFGQLWTLAVKYAGYSASIEVVEEITSLPDCADNADESVEAFDNLTIDNLSFKYPIDGGFSLTNLNLKVYAGVPTVIMGESGCGKSTLLNLIAGLLEHESGHIKLGSNIIDSWSPEKRGKYIGYVRQNINLFTGTIRENLSLDRFYDDDTLWNVLKVVNLYEYIHSLPNGLDTEIGRSGLELSQGQTHRLGIARTLLRDTPVIILDEPTASLDDMAKKVVFNELNNFCKDKILLYVMHDYEKDLSDTEVNVISWDRLIS